MERKMKGQLIDADAYLSRIGAERPAELTPVTLSKLVRSHLETVPFEVLELTEAKTQPSLEAEGLFEKIVKQRRGGYCFELNKLFYLLLKELGFTCYCVGVRCILGRPEPVAISHRGIIVMFGSEKWYCDVGFGGNGPKDILNLGNPETQTLSYERFRVQREDGQYVIVYYDGDNRPVRMLKFRDEPYLDVDFDMLNGYYSVHPRSPFRAKRILYRCRSDGWISFVGTTCRVFRAGAYTTEEITDESAQRALIRTEFGLTIPQWET